MSEEENESKIMKREEFEREYIDLEKFLKSIYFFKVLLSNRIIDLHKKNDKNFTEGDDFLLSQNDLRCEPYFRDFYLQISKAYRELFKDFPELEEELEVYAKQCIEYFESSIKEKAKNNE